MDPDLLLSLLAARNWPPEQTFEEKVKDFWGLREDVSPWIFLMAAMACVMVSIVLWISLLTPLYEKFETVLDRFAGR